MRRNALAILFAAMAALHLLPVWRAPYVPTVDGPSHLYNAVVLRELAAGTPQFARAFVVDGRPWPNWLTHLLLAGALSIAPQVVAEKLVASLIVLLFLGGCWRIAGLVDGASRVYAFVVMPLAFHLLFQMGFYNYALGVALVPFAIASWWRRRERDGWRSVAATASWLLLCYFSHVVPAAAAVLFIGVLWLAVRDGRRWRQLLPLVPAAALLVWFALQPQPPGGTWTWHGALLWTPLLKTMLLLTFDIRQLTFGAALAAVLAAAIVATFALENVDRQRRRIVFGRRDVFLLLAAIATALYLAAPLSAEEGLVLKARLLIFPYLLVLPWLTPRLGRGAAGFVIAAIFSIVAMKNVLFLRDSWKRDAKEIARAVAPLHAAPPLRTIVALVFDRSAPHSTLGLLGHAASYGAAAQRLVDLSDYEANLPFFPVQFRRGLQRPPVVELETKPGDFDPAAWAGAVDSIYTWKMPAGAPLESRLRARYDLAADDGDAKLWIRRR